MKQLLLQRVVTFTIFLLHFTGKLAKRRTIKCSRKARIEVTCFANNMSCERPACYYAWCQTMISDDFAACYNFLSLKVPFMCWFALYV